MTWDLHRAWRGLGRALGPAPVRVRRRWLHCPICDCELVGPYPAGAIVGGSMNRSVIEPTRDEPIAKCPEHGGRPYNDPTGRPSISYVPLD